MSKRDYYEILGVPKSATKDDLKKAYRKLALKYHPDRNPGDKQAEANFKECSEAAEVLINEEKRKKYDQFGHAGVNGQAGFGSQGFNPQDFGDLGDIFGDIFGDFFGGRGQRRRSQGQPGDDLQTGIEVTFKEAAFGAKKNISIPKNVECEECHGSGGKEGSKPVTCNQCHGHGEIRRQQGFFTVASTCPKCNGSGQTISNPCPKCNGQGRHRKKVDLEVSIPAGIDSGQRLKLTGEGGAGAQGGHAGDLYLEVVIKDDDFFAREGFDVHCTIPITFSQAALGGDIEVPTLDGKVALTVPAGTQSGTKMRVKAKGIQKLGQSGRGDQIVKIHVETPTKLNAEQKKLLKDLSNFDKSKSNPMREGFFEKFKDLF